MIHDDRDERHRIEALAVRAYPEEACGVVMARASVRILRPCANVAPVAERRVRFRVGPADLAWIAELTDGGYLLDTLWHSHPDHPATFSATDMQEAMCGEAPCFPWAVHKIVSIVRGRVHAWSAVRWADDSRAFRELPAWSDCPMRTSAA